MRERLLAALSSFFGGLAALPTIGIYGVLAYNTVRRHNETSLAVAHVAESLLFGISPRDPSRFGAAAIGSCLPARALRE